MYWLLLLLALANLSESHYGRHRHHGYRYTYHHHQRHFVQHDRQFKRLADHVIAADRYLHGFCKRNSNCDVQEVFEDQGYKLVYVIPQCSVNYISVKIKHKVIYMSARQTTSYRPETFADMRILPDMLKVNDATWIYEDSKLEILIPYKVDFKTATEKTCGDINTRVIIVPQWGFRFANRFGGDEEAQVTDPTQKTEIDEQTTSYYDLLEPSFNDSKSSETINSNDESEKLIFSS